jgi:hypothetical protein
MPKSLVERLESLRFAALQASVDTHTAGKSGAAYWIACKRTETIEEVANLAKPYEKRREALEEVAKLASHLLDRMRFSDVGPGLNEPRTCLRAAIAAVPEIPEET